MPAALKDRFGELVLAVLAPASPCPEYLARTVRRGAVRLLDSEIIVEDAICTPPALGDGPRSPLGLPQEIRAAIDGAVSGVRAEGLARHFEPLMRSFARATFNVFASPEQLERVRQWRNEGLASSFLMTDRGGPAIQNWVSAVFNEDGKTFVRVDKIWAMRADRLGFALVVARAPAAVFPTALLLPPESCARLKNKAVGASFLEGQVQLGNVSGTVEVQPGDRVMGGGASTVSRLLSMVRPHFVRALTAHLLWLAEVSRLRLGPGQAEAVAALHALASAAGNTDCYSSATLGTALALKFACNELMQDLVAEGLVEDAAAQRDLLAFTKMEGSSYRCLRELYARARYASH